MSKLKFPDFAEMSGPSLVDQFNAMLEWPEAKLLEERRYRPVSQFKSREIGIKRCEALASSLRATKDVEKEVKPHERKPETKMTNDEIKIEELGDVPLPKILRKKEYDPESLGGKILALAAGHALAATVPVAKASALCRKVANDAADGREYKTRKIEDGRVFVKRMA